MVPYLRPLMVLGKSLWSIIALRTSQETDFAVQNKSMHKLKCLKIPFHLINKVKLHGKTMDCHPLNFCKMYMPLLWQSLPNISTRKPCCTIKFYRLGNFYSRCFNVQKCCHKIATCKLQLTVQAQKNSSRQPTSQVFPNTASEVTH